MTPDQRLLLAMLYAYPLAGLGYYVATRRFGLRRFAGSAWREAAMVGASVTMGLALAGV